METAPGTLVPEGRFAMLPNGLRIWYHELGDGPALVLLHGGSRTSRGWLARMIVFAVRFRVIAVDSRGHGMTVNPKNRLTYPMMADDIAFLLDALDIRTACIFGFSDGAQVALDLALRRPDRVAAMALGGVVFRRDENYLKAVRQFFGGPIESDVDLDRFARENPNFVADLVALHMAQGEDHWRRLLPMLWRLFNDPFDGQAGYSDEQLKAMTVPTLLLSGDRDELIPLEHTLELFRLLPVARLRVEPGHGHGTHPSWTDLVADFVTEQALQPAAARSTQSDARG